MKTTERPIFIVGVHRSGTTLLRYMLNSHPRLYIPPESDFIPRFFQSQPTANLPKARIRRILATIFTRYRFVREWTGPVPGPEDFLAQLPGRTPAAVLETLYRAYAAQKGAARWGDKTPIYSSYLPLLDRIFPEAQFIHLYRDGRDVAVSMLEKWGARDFHIDIYFTARNWDWRTRQARTTGAALGPDRYYELGYEALVADPATHLRALCDFLEETYHPAMAEPHRLAQNEVEPGSFHDPVRRPPSTARTGRWRTELSPRDVRLFQVVAGPLLHTLGYALAPETAMQAGEWVRFAALQTKYRVLQSGRRVLQALGIFPPI